MNLRRRLLLTFLAIAIVVMLIFGTVAHQLALDTAEAEEIHLLEGLTSSLAGTLHNIDESLWPEPTSGAIIVRLDSSGKFINNKILQNSLLKGIQSSQLVNKFIHENSGEFIYQETEFVWAKAAIPDSPDFILIFHHSNDAIAMFDKIGIRLIVTGLIVAWIAIWTALLLSSSFTRRIESQNKKILHQAMYDELTNLPNRNLLIEQLKNAIVTGRRKGKPFALCVMDLNNFKDINDTLGHSSGDILLQQVAKRLSNIMRESDIIARLGGDEFAILLPEAGAFQAKSYVNRMINTLSDPFEIGELNIQTSASLGIAIYPEHGEDPELLIQHADVAMYQAKMNGRDYEIYTPENDPNSLKKLTLMNDLHTAIENNEFELYYQPKINLKTHTIYGVEALIRWHHKDFGFIPPDDFISLAEKTGFIKPLTEWVIEESIRQCKQWKEMGINLRVSINISMRNLYDKELPHKISTLLHDMNVDYSDIELEITETAAMSEPENTMITLRQINKLGIRLSIDDFGTGFTSLAYLRDLPVDELKIDKSFVMNMCTEENDKMIVRTIIELAHNMGREVVAEGVETLEAMEILAFMKCDNVQGYYFSKPLPVTELNTWLTDSEWRIRA